MRYYAGLDLHSNNTYLGILDAKGTKVYKDKVQNHLQMILNVFKPYQKSIAGAVVESSFKGCLSSHARGHGIVPIISWGTSQCQGQPIA